MTLIPGGEGRSDLRVSDDDREEVVAELRRHFAAGRLTLEEFEERTADAWRSRTFADLQCTLRELPVSAALAPRAEVDTGFRPHLNCYLVVNGFLVLIWLLTSPGGYFWPVWPAAGWGIAVALHWLGSRNPTDG